VLEKATVQSAPSGDQKRVGGGLEIDVPAGALPADRKLILYATDPATSAQARSELTLDKDLQPTVEIQLPKISAKVKGRVLGNESGAALPGALVNVRGYEGEAVRAGPGGEFTLDAHSPPGQMVWLKAMKDGFKTAEQEHPAGDAPATITLEREGS
jgi:hypothetical protein